MAQNATVFMSAVPSPLKIDVPSMGVTNGSEYAASKTVHILGILSLSISQSSVKVHL